MVSKVLLGVLVGLVAVAQGGDVLTLLSTTGDGKVKSTAPYGDYVYTGYYHKIKPAVYNVQDPTNPVLVRRFGHGDEASYKVQVVGSILYVRKHYSITSYSLADPENPVEVANYQTGCYSFTWSATDHAMKDDHLYLYCRIGVLKVVKTDASGALTPVNSVSLGFSGYYTMTVVGDVLYLFAEVHTIKVFDVSTAASPVATATWHYGDGRYFYDVVHYEGYLYIAGFYPVLTKIDATTGALQAITLPPSVLPAGGSVAIDHDAAYFYVATYYSGGLFVLYEGAPNEFALVESHLVGRPTDIVADDGQLFAASFNDNKWWIYEHSSPCTLTSGTVVTIDGETVPGEELGGANTYTKGARQLSRIPTNFRGMRAHVPDDMILAGAVIELSCCASVVCEFVVSHYHCPPCSRAVNGGFPAALPEAGFESGSCAPKYGATEERMTSYRVQVQPGQTLTLDPIEKEATSFAVFSQEGAFEGPWCTASRGRPGCGGPCPTTPCACIDTQQVD